MASYELYRKSSIGMSLTDALDELVTNGTISPLLAVKVLMQFDRGHLHTYRFCDNVWTFILEQASFKTDNDVTAVDRVKIVACDAKILAR
ncbi:transcription initiation factor IIA subunit 2 isoform X2 [Physcomitrium patens]|uniref:Transcription initiation factor IIA subunit 2 n=1 Tax=Physcomitrium patens TaxID=3218 RepID=A0A7I4AVA7_PHYPA|nr:transcription initiation factor IIA subunit 2-like isoform X2 [Physcomitrium patens]|eukprot:XP_024396064.1 transcription initiation factor IIA subunit 2-like isoform X2 [Physcomitrella patens]